MARTIAIDIITPERVVFRDEIEIIILPAIDGMIGILPGHAPLVTGVKIGVAKIRKDGQEFFIAITGGILEVQPDQINLIVDTAELPSEIDVDRALRAKERAEQRLSQANANIDQARAQAAFERAVARLKAAGHSTE